MVFKKHTLYDRMIVIKSLQEYGNACWFLDPPKHMNRPSTRKKHLNMHTVPQLPGTRELVPGLWTKIGGFHKLDEDRITVGF